MKRRVIAQLDGEGKVTLGNDLPGWLKTFLECNELALARWLQAPGLGALPDHYQPLKLDLSEPLFTDSDLSRVLSALAGTDDPEHRVRNCLSERVATYQRECPDWTAKEILWRAASDLLSYQLGYPSWELPGRLPDGWVTLKEC